jgi:signal transduction histidine kinase
MATPNIAARTPPVAQARFAEPPATAHPAPAPALDGGALPSEEVLSLIAHELRNPLAVIAGLADVLRRRGSRMPGEEHAAALLQIGDEASRLQRTVASMLLLADRGPAVRAAVEPLSLQRVLRAHLQNRQRRQPADWFEIDVPTSLPPVLAHEGFLLQIVDNLLSNASKYGRSGKPIAVQARHVQSVVRICITNDGDRVSAGDAERLFEPFFRSAEGRVHAPGLGLGLVVCRRLAEAQGATISAAPRPGGGLTVALELPVATP